MSLENLRQPSPETMVNTEAFEHGSLLALREQLAEHRPERYPIISDRLHDASVYRVMNKNPDAPWKVGQQIPALGEYEAIRALGLAIDDYERPVHPWLENMLKDPGIGAVTGKGMFYEWGPNHTADAVVIRGSNVLLVKRGDTGLWALPGGFIDKGRDTSGVAAALRELNEETGVDLRYLADAPPHDLCRPQSLYRGPVADIRMTANAWPETEAVMIDLGDTMLFSNVRGLDDAKEAAWVPLDIVRQPTVQLYGSHKLLIELSWQQLCRRRDRLSETAYL